MAGNETSTEQAQTKKPADSNWLVDNVAHPFANAAGLEPYNAVASLVNMVHHDTLPEVSLYSVPEASGIGWLTQTVSGGVGGLVPFIVAGKLTGSTMRGTGRFLESASLIEGSGLAAKVLASERLAMITGAGLYGAAQKPQDGQTRLGNSASALVGMGAFELGGKLTEGTPIISLAGFKNRAIVGFAGGSLGSMTGNAISSWQNTGRVDVGSIESITKAGVSGATLNMLLPVAQRGIDVAKLNLGMSIPVKNYVEQKGWGQDRTLAAIVDQSPLSNVAIDPLIGRIAPNVTADMVHEQARLVLNGPRIDQTANVIHLPSDAKAPELAHEVVHRIRLKADEARFQDAARHLDANKPESFNSDLARQKYIDIRLSQEAEARIAQNSVAGNDNLVIDKDAILKSQANEGQTYRQKFEQEADQFVKDGKFRPTEDNYGVNKTTGLFEQIYDPPVEKAGYGLTSKYELSRDNQFERYTIVDADGTELKKVEVYKQPQETNGYGTFRRAELLPNGGEIYQIIKGAKGVIDIPDNSVIEIYRDGLDTPQFGNIQMVIRDAAEGVTKYRKTDGNEAFEYSKPEELWSGVEFNAIDNQAGRTVYHLTDGGKAEHYPGRLQTDFVKADGSKLPLKVETVLRQGTRTTYVVDDQAADPNQRSQMIVDNDGQKLSATRYDHNFKETGKFTLTHSSELNPEGTTVMIGDTSLLNVHTIEHRADSTVYRTPDSATQVYDENHALPTKWGDVRRVDFLPNEFKNYFKDDGTQILTNPNGIKTKYGRIETKESLPDHTVRYTRASGNTITEYPSAINGIFPGMFGGNSVSIMSVETSPNGLTVTATGAPWTTADFNFTDNSVNLYNGTALTNVNDLPGKFKFIRQFPDDVYPDGVISPFGPARMITTDGTGANTYTLTDGTVRK